MTKRIITGLIICAVFALAINFILQRITLEKTSVAFERAPSSSVSNTLSVPADAPQRTIAKNILRPAPEINQAAAVRADQKVRTLREILRSKNDNDPRLDSEFTNLNEVEKERLRQEYKSMPRESFNDKGTVVYLLGRNIKSAQDIKFLSEVLGEEPCNNMTDCAKPAPAVDSEAIHEASADSITLAYPQIVSLKSLEPYIDAPPADPLLKQSVFEALRSGANSKNFVVSKMARDYTKRYLGGNGG